MAHTQPVLESAEAYYEKNKKAVDEIVKISSDVVAKHCDQTGKRDKLKDAAITGGRIHNNAKGDCIKFHDKHDWSGQCMPAYPNTIAKGYTGDFVHFVHTNSDEAAVVYADGGGVGWLLAWSVGGHSSFNINPNKVYVEVGPIDKYKKIEWGEVKAKLVTSRDLSSYTDETTGCMAFATVSPGKKAAVIATFNAMMSIV